MGALMHTHTHACTHTMYFPYSLNRYYNALPGPILLEVSLNPDYAMANAMHVHDTIFKDIKAKAVMHLISLYRIVENRNFLKYFQIVYNSGFWNNDRSCEDKLWARKSGLYTIYRLSFA